jgi:cell division septal protein FtsQ
LVRLDALLIEPRKLLRPVVVSATVAIFTALIAVAGSYLLFPVSGIEVRGARMFPELEVWRAVPHHASLLFLSPDRLETQAKINPWVKSAKVLKDWESGIVTVEVEERKPMLNGDLGTRRVVFAADGTELPGLGGADLERVELDEAELEGILKVSQVLEENGVVLDSVDGLDAGGVETTTVEGRRVLFADDVGTPRAQALKDLTQEYPEAPYFDLRSPHRVIVGPEPKGLGE